MEVWLYKFKHHKSPNDIDMANFYTHKYIQVFIVSNW